LFENSSSEENMILLANLEAISAEMDIYSIHQVFFKKAAKENVVINHIIGVKGNNNDIFHDAFRLVVENAIEGKIVGLKGKIEARFKET
jgi:hypothetical protein